MNILIKSQTFRNVCRCLGLFTPVLILLNFLVGKQRPQHSFIESLIFKGLFMKFCALKLGKNTVIQTASPTATLLNMYKKIVFFKI
ncbi:hypothetical protein AVDCRST_MAG84-7614 [uncultured Microcoleus sp.]|uniref:Uncharacterized protein n=1 Tax=uncultured Microcoleus sp. TaxID=259945 RepID=A0A6J4PWU4_9CYAN|nr:hypothetical protein AVDCRST_MAG84-7614 [uncultured Microcoleus sp.]